MIAEKCGINFIDRITISIDMLYLKNDKIMESCSSLFNKKLKHIINKNIEELALNVNGGLSLNKVILNLGDIEIDLFETEMPSKLETELKKNLNKYYGYSKYTSSAEKISCQQSENNIFASTFNGTPLIEKIDHYLGKGNWLSDDNKPHVTNTVCIDNELWQQIKHQPQQWLPMLAKHCLQPASLSRLIQICQPDILSMLFQLFTETTTSEFVNSQVQANIDIKVTPEKLSLAAEHYLRYQMKSVNTTQPGKRILQDRDNSKSVKNAAINSHNPLTPDILTANTPFDTAQPILQQSAQTCSQIAPAQWDCDLIKNTGEQNPATLQNRKQHKELLKSALAASTQISSIPSGNGIQSPSTRSVLPISNAGCMILWPLLPTFFRIFDLLEKNQFISLEAQREAVCLLDWLIWAEEEIPAWRLTLNKVICGLPVNDSTLCNPPAPAKQIAINQWLEKTIEQLPVWKKMGINDVRHLFLQRFGEVSELNSMTNIHIKPEVYDALISEWPWPINIASFSWLQQPITITW
ncbi:contractile injection system tape measure protein [Xenorhabdus cabanillasii]|uniref:contractile injection system tape measure protein n=1 Tax=Xenorhabdus cabanillasii TaxID=351673 RepID=UPI0004B3A57F|nr:contractile injection system tape measure protein [Xenorhabdus cabanillasii]